MKRNRIVSLLLSIIMVLGMTAVPTFAEGAEITAYVNVGKYGEIQQDKSGNSMVLAPVELSGKESYVLDDLFKEMHDKYYEGGSEAGYASAASVYITKCWGDVSGDFGYQVNGGTESVMGLSHPVKNNDVVDVAIYKNSWPDTESYTAFDEYKKDSYVGIATELTLTRTDYDDDFNEVVSPCENATITVDGVEQGIKTNADGKASLTFDTVGEYVVSAKKTKQVSGAEVPEITAPVCVVKVKPTPDASITVPSNAKLYVGKKGSKHFVKFTEIKPAYSVSDGANMRYYFELDNNSKYNYRISGDNYITYGGTFNKTADFSLNITEEKLMPTGKTKKTVDRSEALNGGQNVADIYLNINPKGYLKLAENDTYQLVTLRNWEAIDGFMANYFIEPDFHFAVTDENGNESDVVEIDANGLLTAKKSGTAIVYVTYDAMTLNYGNADDFYSAIYPENTGVFVVSVNASDSDIDMGMTINEGKNSSQIKLSGDNIDSEHDCIYYIGNTGEYTFTPQTADVRVYVANPSVTDKMSYSGYSEVKKNGDGSYTVPLKTGRNIVKAEKDGKAEYQIITAKKVSVKINNDEPVQKGDAVTIVFDKLYHPANKLAGVYNMTAIAFYTDVSGYEGQIIGAESGQYTFANVAEKQTIRNILKKSGNNYSPDGTFVVPDDYAYDTLTLSGGVIYTSGWGDPYGNHRFITYENGKGANKDALARLGYFSKLPDIEIPIVATTAELSSITLNTDSVKTSYFSGEKFDRTNLVVTANYADETTQLALNYTVTPETLTADTDKVVVTYKNKTAEIPVSVVDPKVTSIEITAPPTTLTYREGDVFNPSGMTVTATYENGKTEETSNYSYSPNRELTTDDTSVTVFYTGENAVEGIAELTQPITVIASGTQGGGTVADKINVYFTLLGDKKHGTLSSESDTHTKKKGNLEVWIARSQITLDRGSYAIDAVRKALGLNGIPFTCENNYISEIKGLSEIDNGDLSGWMYTLNGRYTLYGVEEQLLANGDELIFHYTDDYTAENTQHFGGGGSASSNSKQDEKTDSDKDDEKADDKQESPTPAFDEGTYNDVKSSDWFYEAVKFAYEEGLMQGTGEAFEPESKMTRAMLVAVLWRMEKEPNVNFAMPFADVEAEQWYTEAIRWAASEGLISGISDGLFGTNEELTREQLAVILYSYVQKKGISTEVDEDVGLSSFDDVASVSDYAAEAMRWAVATGIVQGRGDNKLYPTESATRAEVAEMLRRFCGVIDK